MTLQSISGKKGVKSTNFHNNFVDLNFELGMKTETAAKRLGQVKVN